MGTALSCLTIFSPTASPLLIAGVWFYVGADVFFEEFQDFARVGVPFEHFFGIKYFIIHFELKRATGTGDKGKLFDNVLVIGEDFVRHTDGTGAIVSRDAVFEGDGVFVHMISIVARLSKSRYGF